MDKQALLSADYLDIIFENRNKDYGGYELRKHYKVRACKATLSVLLVCSVYVAVSYFKGPEESSGSRLLMDQRHIIADVTRLVVPSRPEPARSHAGSRAPALKSTVPVIVEDHKADPKDVLPDIVEMKDKQPGAGTTAGDSAAEGGTLPGEGTEGVKETLDEKPIRFATEMPRFEGSISAYLNSHLKYPAFAKENNIEGKVIIEFIINEDGTISNAVVKRGIGGGCDEEALRVVNAMPRWKPGSQNDKAVKVYMLLPIRFELD